MKTIRFIRHSESSANAGLATSSPKTTPITERGHTQAVYLSQSLCDEPDLIVTSGYLRTQQTAEPTLKKFPGAAHEEWQVEEFTYLEPSRLANTTMAYRKPMVTEYWKRCQPDYQDGPGAESFASFMGRVQNFLALLSKRQEKNGGSR